ncbi:hypothetical protein NP493_1790g00010 [Ridgeia piscesae]|uniref:FAM21/CAPZIP domain-containing protein n=1 Tax=Ridgeia piscesae TaxID=27915 RepID=A0AAD9JSW7_RIDPI|nr:hypothetical protein NP493_1790g00010 [Ridgeia piscesae]
MFGGIDPAMVGRTRSSGRPPVTEKPNKPDDDFIDQTDKQFTKSSSEGATVKPGASSLPTAKSDMEPPVGKSQTSPDIRSKQASLTLDPSVLLPGGSGPRKKVEPGRALEGAASFEEPVQNPVLHSVSKDRARVQVKRRPPSRKSRLNVNSDPSSEDVPDSTVVTDRGVDPGRAPNIPPTDDSLFSLHNDNKSTTSKKTQKRDLFSDEADDLLAAAENIITSSGEIPDSVLSHRDDIGTGPSVVTTRQSTSKTRATEGLFGDDEVIHPQGSKFSQSERPNTDQLPQRVSWCKTF